MQRKPTASIVESGSWSPVTTGVAALAVAFATLVAACGTASNGEEAPASASESPSTAEAREEVANPPRPLARRPVPGRAWVIFGSDTIEAEVARTAEERARGLMYRDELPEDTGMLFVFEDAAIRSFWMQNTYIPLDIAYLDPSFRILSIHQMEPETTEGHESAGPAMFAVEVNQGWFEAHGVEEGDVAEVVFGG